MDDKEGEEHCSLVTLALSLSLPSASFPPDCHLAVWRNSSPIDLVLAVIHLQLSRQCHTDQTDQT